MRSIIIKNLFIWLVFSFYFFQVMQKVHSQAYRVEIRNSLPNNTKTPLVFRCQSKDDDLGYHSLTPGGEYYWDFDLNFFMSTLFFCHFYWGPKDSVFDVFTWKLAKKNCDSSWFFLNKCVWFVTEDGFSIWQRVGDNQGLKMMHRW
ncbi:hypothetical protein M9H77_37146 [Catharanthus roseus]|uniref:Uncharacterized protein n=1 Tax=Catharanthus roseus TaxID=4058 RepID=A0ACB9ZTT1_CATRO|nr:hypothetical protein M9H77_37146 [Catharanthus roseus]